MKTFFYIDGFNFYYSAVKDTPLRWLNFQSLFQRVFPRNEITFIKYFTAEVRNLPPGDSNQALRQQVYWRALKTLPNFEMYLGDFRTRRVWATPVEHPRRKVEIYKTEEKGSDVNLAAHLLMDGFKDAYDCAIVISGDSDLVTPIKMVRDQLRKPAGVLNPQRLSGPNRPDERRSAGLKQAATFYKKGLTWSQLEKSRFPDQIENEHGHIHCPESWKADA